MCVVVIIEVAEEENDPRQRGRIVILFCDHRSDRLGLISYYDATNNRNLKVAHCSDQACTFATLTTLDDTGDVGQDTSVTIGADGLGLISYHDVTNGNLKVAHCSNRACTAATLSVPGQRR